MGTYVLFQAGGVDRAGAMQQMATDPSPPHWLTYLGTDDVDATTQGVLADLRERGGGDFDRAWLQAAGTVVGQGREAADGIRASPGAPREAVSVAGNLQARLAALANALGHAIARGTGPTR